MAYSIRARRPILNQEESQVADLISRAASSQGTKLYCKLRIADVINIKRSGLTQEEYRYALSAHFDFVVASNELAEMAIELDGPGHLINADTIERDRLKNSIARKFDLPLLRIDLGYLRPIEGQPILSHLLKAFMTGRKDSVKERIVAVGSFESDLYSKNSKFRSDLHNRLQNGYSEKDLKRLRCGARALQSATSLIEPDPFAPYRQDLLEIMKRDGCDVSLNTATDIFDHSLAAVLIQGPEGCVVGYGRCFNSTNGIADGSTLAKDLAIFDAVENFQLFAENLHSGVELTDAQEIMASLSGGLDSFESSFSVASRMTTHNQMKFYLARGA